MRPAATVAAPTDWSSVMPGLALAAVMLVALGTVSFFLARSSSALPQTFELAAITRHDGCCNAPDHHKPGVPQASYTDMGRYLRQQLNHPVLAADMGKDRWQFQGAAICPIAGVPAAHLLFKRGSQSLSVFSLPASSLPSLQENQTYEGVAGDHSVVARREDGAIYCLVGHCPAGELTVAELDRLLAAHESEATVAAVPGPPISLAGILREP